MLRVIVLRCWSYELSDRDLQVSYAMIVKYFWIIITQKPGKSRRSGDISKQVGSIEIVIRDKTLFKDKAKALKQHEMMTMDLDATELAADEKIVSKMAISGMHLEGYESRLVCKAG